LPSFANKVVSYEVWPLVRLFRELESPSACILHFLQFKEGYDNKVFCNPLHKVWSSAKQNKRFLLSFWKKKITTRPIDVLRASPQTPRVGFAEFWVAHGFCEAELSLLASFFWKKKNNLRLINYRFLGSSVPNPQGRLQSFG
jgi:hypothetical protein